MPIIAQSVPYDVILKENRDYRQRTMYTVIYGLEVNQYDSLNAALMGFRHALAHSMTCDDALDPETD